LGGQVATHYKENKGRKHEDQSLALADALAPAEQFDDPNEGQQVEHTVKADEKL
jgi:hypothetical protein